MKQVATTEQPSTFTLLRLHLNAIAQATENIVEYEGHISNEVSVITASLDALELNIGEIVDWATSCAKAFLAISDGKSDTPYHPAMLSLHHETTRDISIILRSNIDMAKSFYEGTVRAQLKQEQADAEATYFKNKRIDVLCDADNAAEEEFCGRDGEGEPT